MGFVVPYLDKDEENRKNMVSYQVQVSHISIGFRDSTHARPNI